MSNPFQALKTKDDLIAAREILLELHRFTDSLFHYETGEWKPYEKEPDGIKDLLKRVETILAATDPEKPAKETTLEEDMNGGRMEINAPKETKVIFAHPNSGYSGDQERARKHLKVGATYTVERTEIHSWSTSVYLKEVPGVGFNSVHFKET